MRQSWQCLILAAADDDQIFYNFGYNLPKNLIEVDGKSVLSHSIDSYSKNSYKTTLVIKSSESNTWNTAKMIKQDFPFVKIKEIENSTSGALCTALLTVDNLDDEIPLVITSGDTSISGGIDQYVDQFIDSGAAAGTIVFKNSHPRWSYARVRDEGLILEMAEKSPISKFASTGVFMFKDSNSFINSATWVLKNNIKFQNEFYLSATLNFFILQNKAVTAIALKNSEDFRSYSLPSDLKKVN